ncbi:hypothetical protein [Flavobacterium taihuense]|uniref:DUF4251 domain containing protein n=1 Tax=Flavobacterium taihuense TaxID=2857508 RepID=A0ABS6XRT1_9FLAO|nr:hypothetical protein [Flavobacterium taihuense]MBW4359387.1 hypothetical protein [Flavobacterium taihuense]
MKKSSFLTALFSLLISSIYTPLYSQDEKIKQEIIAKFKISDGTKNGEDITPYLLGQNAYLVIYKDQATKTICMANFWGKNDSQSYGSIYSMEEKHIKADSENYEADQFFFQWSYTNTYDNKKGTAKVQLLKVYKPQGIYFKMTIIPENLDVLVYKGYMEGTLDLTVYNK